jgi:hypothetical protein
LKSARLNAYAEIKNMDPGKMKTGPRNDVYYDEFGLVYFPGWFTEPLNLEQAIAELGDTCSEKVGSLLPARIGRMPRIFHLLWWIATDSELFLGDGDMPQESWTFITLEEFDAWLKSMGFTGRDMRAKKPRERAPKDDAAKA